MEILDANGRLYAESIKVNPITVNNDGGFFRVTPRISGVFPKGGVFFKVSDTLDSGSRTTLGMFGVTTVN